jgi:hypothetical protein
MLQSELLRRLDLYSGTVGDHVQFADDVDSALAVIESQKPSIRKREMCVCFRHVSAHEDAVLEDVTIAS